MSRASQANAVRVYWCSCGARVRGNGPKSSHQRLHFRKGEKHRYLGANGHKYPEVTDEDWQTMLGRVRWDDRKCPTGMICVHEVKCR